MPRVVDHDARRQAIVESLVRITAREGLAAASSRAIAADLGLAAGAIWYYFEDFDSVIAAAHDLVFERANRRVEQAVAGSVGVEAVYRMMRELLPLTRETRDEAHIVVHFWGHVATNSLLAEANEDVESIWRTILLRSLLEGVAAGDLDGTDEQLDIAVDALMTIVLGQQVAAVTTAMRTTPSRPLTLVDVVIDSLRSASRRRSHPVENTTESGRSSDELPMESR
jgi:AcrR family transcriptional regulator